MRFRPRTLKARIMLIFFVSFTFTQILFSVFVIQRYTKAMEDTERQFMLENLKTIQNQISSLRYDMIKMSNLLANSDHLVGMLRENVKYHDADGFVENAFNELTDYRLSPESFSTINRIETVLEASKIGMFFNYRADIVVEQDNGLVYVSSDSFNGYEFKLLAMDYHRRNGHFIRNDQRHGTGLTWTAPYSYPAPGLRDRSYLSLSRSVFDPLTGEFLCTMAVNLDVENLSGAIRKDSQSELAMFTNDGKLIYSNRETDSRRTSSQNEDVTTTVGIPRSGWRLEAYRPRETAYSSIRPIRNASYLMSLMTLLTSIVVTTYAISQLMKPLQQTIEFISHVAIGNYHVAKPRDTKLMDIDTLSHTIGSMVTEIRTLVRKIQDDERIAQELKFEALQAQIDPHFIFNTLDSIKWMAAMSGSSTITRAIDNLCQLLADRFKNTEDETTLERELDYLEKYLALQNIGYLNAIDYRIDVPNDMLTKRVIKMILQPVVENSIVHGYSESNHSFRIDISVRLEDGLLIIIVADNGTEPSHRQSQSHGTALKNIEERIRIRYGIVNPITITREGGRTVTTIVLPDAG